MLIGWGWDTAALKTTDPEDRQSLAGIGGALLGVFLAPRSGAMRSLLVLGGKARARRSLAAHGGARGSRAVKSAWSNHGLFEQVADGMSAISPDSR
ncbi:MAG: hypothetical protein IPH37_16890 [Burkholderiales bacterium]|nr:hypothetical protein [Burkholderiales bacterium]